MDDYGMLEVHRALLMHNRVFLLRNIFPSEDFWSQLLEKELLTTDMMEDIKVLLTSIKERNRQIFL